MNRHLRIKNFVQSVLGCTCPDKVFEQIKEGRITLLPKLRIRSITIGGKLLIYIWQVGGDLTGKKENLFSLLHAGKKERENSGLSRFRAVLVSANPQTVETQAKLYFSQFKDRDERMHVHVVSASAFKELS